MGQASPAAPGRPCPCYRGTASKVIRKGNGHMITSVTWNPSEDRSTLTDHLTERLLIERGGSAVLLCGPPKNLLAAVDNPTRPSASVPKSTAGQTKNLKLLKRGTP